MFAGELSIQMTFTYTDDSAKTYVRHTEACKVTVTPISDWSSMISDSALKSLDEKLVDLHKCIDVIGEIADQYNRTKADNHALDENGDLILLANGLQTGDPISVVTPSVEDDEDGTADSIIDLSVIYSI